MNEDIETIAGLVVKLLGRIAEVNDTVTFENLTFIVKEVEGARITKLEIFQGVEESKESEEAAKD